MAGRRTARRARGHPGASRRLPDRPARTAAGSLGGPQARAPAGIEHGIGGGAALAPASAQLSFACLAPGPQGAPGAGDWPGRQRGELVGLHRQLTQLLAAAERYRSDAVAPSADLVRIAETAYRAGESTILELLDAYKGALDAETTALDLEWKAREVRIELDQMTGNHPQ
ncbi:MAG: hypothetical protein IPL72_00165 [Sulfuritalea sp.]|nr:hypothetical protein [Sulfuritalea sp.]